MFDFYDDDGNECKALNLEWFPRQDLANITYTIAKQLTDNLKEEFIEA